MFKIFNVNMQSQVDRLTKRIEELEEKLKQPQNDPCKSCEIQVGIRDMNDDERRNMNLSRLFRFFTEDDFEKAFTVPVMMPTSTVVKMIMLHQNIELKHTPEETKTTTRHAQTVIVEKPKPAEKKKPAAKKKVNNTA